MLYRKELNKYTIMIRKGSENSFTHVDEKPTSDIDENSQEISARILYNKKEFLANQKSNEALEVEEESRALSHKLKSTISQIKTAQMFLSSTELEEFLNLEEYINKIEENNLTSIKGDINQSMDFKYIESIRKQQAIMERILKQISILQWEVELEYNKIKEIEDYRRKRELEANCKPCTLETSNSATSPVCSCAIF